MSYNNNNYTRGNDSRRGRYVNNNRNNNYYNHNQNPNNNYAYNSQQNNQYFNNNNNNNNNSHSNGHPNTTYYQQSRHPYARSQPNQPNNYGLPNTNNYNQTYNNYNNLENQYFQGSKYQHGQIQTPLPPPPPPPPQQQQQHVIPHPSRHTQNSQDNCPAPKTTFFSKKPLPPPPPSVSPLPNLPILEKNVPNTSASINTILPPNEIEDNFESNLKDLQEKKLDRNIEILTRKDKILKWKQTKDSKMKKDSSVTKKKSLMKFSKKNSNKKNSKITTDTKSSLVNHLKNEFDNEDNDIGNDYNKINDPVISSDIISNYETEEMANKIHAENKDEIDIDIDTVLSSYQNIVPEHTKINVLDNDIYLEEEEGKVEIDKDAENAEKMLDIIHNTDKKEIPIHEFPSIPFTKKFYKESDFTKSIANMEVKKLRDNDSVFIKGKGILKPILEWSQLGLPNLISKVLEQQKFDSPTPIQCEALPHIMDGNDFIGIAKTGSGKTIAYLLPLFRQLLSNENVISKKSFIGATPRAIIVTPTRELTLQIAANCKPFADSLNLKVCKCYGGQTINKQISDLRKHPDIIVGTPGRIIDLLCTNGGKILNLANVTYLVLDEADRMFDMGFEPQMLKILKVIRPDRQTVLFSATFPPKIQLLVRKILKDPIEVSIGSKNLVNEQITQNFEIVNNEDEKFNTLLQILGTKYNDKNGKVLIFIETQDRCDKMVKKLISRGYAAMSLHGGKDQTERDGTIKDFQNGIIDIVVATSVASRGLDVDNLNLVINYDPPSHIEDYVHRVGRTGRGGKTGESFTILTYANEKCAYDLMKILKNSKQEIPDFLKEMAEKFAEKVKNDDVKFSSGFGGKGLEKLQAIRENNEKMEKKVYLKASNNDADVIEEDMDDDNREKQSNSRNGTEFETEGSIVKNIITNFKVEETVDNDGKISYFARLLINDLPNNVRWAVTSKQTYLLVSELTGASITTKGQFYSAGHQPRKGEPEKLYVLVEGSHSSVQQAITVFREEVLKSLAKSVDEAVRR